MARRIATVSGTALAPGVSRNGRLYTREAIAKAVARGRERLADGIRPLSMKTHHGAEDDSTRIAGRITSLTLAADGSARFTADIADTEYGRTIADLADTSDGQPAFLRGVSIRGAWMGEPKRVIHDGQPVETADDLELDGLDFTGKPGVDGAVIDGFQRVAESADGRAVIYESVQEALVTADIGEAAKPLASGKAAIPQTKAGSYADPGYQPDKMKRFALDTKSEAKSAWSFIHQDKNAKNYTGPQLKRIKQRIRQALKKFGVEINTDEGWIIDTLGVVAESAELAEHYDYAVDGDGDMCGTFCIALSNGPVNLTISSYRVDPADLDLIGKAAMAGAVACLASLDPDMDGDMDVPGADAEDTDHDMGGRDDDRMESAAPATAAVAESGAAAAEAEGTEDPDAHPAPATEPAPDAAADPNTEEEPVVTEPTTPAVENTPAATDTVPASASALDALGAKFDAGFGKLADALAGFVQAVAPKPATESAPTAPVAEAQAPAPQPVAETEDQRIARLVAEGIAAQRAQIIQDVVESGNGPSRKGLVKPVAETDESDVDGALPEGWPSKPLHKYTAEERAAYFGPQLEAWVTSPRASR